MDDHPEESFFATAQPRPSPPARFLTDDAVQLRVRLFSLWTGGTVKAGLGIPQSALETHHLLFLPIDRKVL